MSTTARRPRRYRLTLRELTLRESMNTAKQVTVDREAGVLRNVKILGWESVNGREYRPEAARAAVPLYEGARVYCDHLDKPGEARKAAAAFGRLANVRWEADGLYGDLCYFKSHELAERVCEDVERGIGFLGLSHNVDAKCDRDDAGTVVITEITAVKSVDLVAEAATNENLWESRTVSQTYRQLLESKAKALDPARRATVKALLEMGDMGDQMDAEADDADGADWKGDLVAAIAKLVGTGDDADHAQAKKIMAMLKPASADAETEDDDAEDGDTKEDDEADDKKGDKEEAADGSDDDMTSKDKKESVRHALKLAHDLRTLREEVAVRDLIEDAGVTFAKAAVRTAYVKSLAALPAADRKAVIEDRKALQESAGKQAQAGRHHPRSSAQGTGVAGKPARDGKSLAESIRG